jgi:TDG/mug DNA glycosylase family protein
VTKELPDIVAYRLDVLFCGINPGMDVAAAGHHFVGRSNRFWRTLHRAGFTPEEISPQEDCTLLRYGCGITSVVKRPTVSADELSPEEFTAATAGFERKIAHYAPRFVAFLGKAAYAGMTRQRDLQWGRQPHRMHSAAVWVLPNPSGRNRAFTLERLSSAYRDLYLEVLATRDGGDLAPSSPKAFPRSSRTATTHCPKDGSEYAPTMAS